MQKREQFPRMIYYCQFKWVFFMLDPHPFSLRSIGFGLRTGLKPWKKVLCMRLLQKWRMFGYSKHPVLWGFKNSFKVRSGYVIFTKHWIRFQNGSETLTQSSVYASFRNKVCSASEHLIPWGVKNSFSSQIRIRFLYEASDPNSERVWYPNKILCMSLL